jgi:exodeoxyribonuclease VII large subunit
MKLAELLSLVQRTLSDALPDTYWVVAELAEVKPSPRGYTHFTLVEKSADTLVAKVAGVMWRQASQSVLPRFRAATGAALAVGMGVLLRVSVQFHIAYGLQLEIHDIDPSYTLGEMARQRREVIERLDRENRLALNKSKPFPLVPQRIALISSRTAAGYEDFVHQIAQNACGYAIRHELFHSLMQGSGAQTEVVDALNEIRKRSGQFDVVVMIRGGGSSVDLSCFDSYAIGAAIADFPLPIITGIGHERDETVADICAHTRVKTPTAAAELIIATIKAFDDRLEAANDALIASARQRLSDENARIESAAKILTMRAAGVADNQKGSLQRAFATVRAGSTRIVERSAGKLDHIETAVRLLDPINVLRRGYSITYSNGRVVVSPANIDAGSTLMTRVLGGTIESKVSATCADPEEQTAE